MELKFSYVLSAAILTSLLQSCSYFKENSRKIASSEKVDLVENAEKIVEKILGNEINGKTCGKELKSLIVTYEMAQDDLNFEQIKNAGQEILDKSFQARLQLHSLLPAFTDDCKIKLRELYRKMRMVEDLVGIYYYNDDQITADTIKYEEEAAPVYEQNKYHPYHVGNGIDPKGKFEFKNGDIMITKGVSFISSTISELAAPKSLFSHIVFVHVDEKTKVASTIESYVGKGVEIYSMLDALKNENSRIVVLRPKNQELAARAANYMFEKVTKLKKQNKVILYDYDLDFSSNETMSCEEVAYDAYKTASGGEFIIPEIESTIYLNDEKFLKKLGIKKGPLMVPTDMETDSRFDIVLDWTDYRIMRDSWRKDALLGETFKRIESEGARIYTGITSLAARFFWSTRKIPGVWGMMSRISGIPKNFTDDVPSDTIATMAGLKSIGGKMLPLIAKADQEFYEKNRRWMTSIELRQKLTELFIEDDKPRKFDSPYGRSYHGP